MLKAQKVVYLLVQAYFASSAITHFYLYVFSGRSTVNDHGFSQRHPSNWVDADEDDDDDNGDENGLCVQSTPPYYEEH